jgi:polyferredoxin
MNVQRRLAGQPSLAPRLIRARTILYAALITLVGALMLYTLLTRSTLGLSVLHDRNPLYVRLSDGSLRNGFTLRITNKANSSRDFLLAVEGLDGVVLDSPPLSHDANGRLIVSIGTDQTAELRVLVTLPKSPQHHHADDQNGLDSSRDLTFRLTDPQAHNSVTAADHFFSP